MRQKHSHAAGLVTITWLLAALGCVGLTAGCKREDASASTAKSSRTNAAAPECTKEEMEKAKRMPKENAAVSTINPSDVPECGVSFYDVDLICKAAPKIGCGSRAKPVLHALLQSSRVAGAWLNEAGTQLAIAWRQDSKPLTADELAAVVSTHGIKLDAVAEAARDQLIATFRRNSGWYDLTTVDRLSEQEAGLIATRLVNRFAAKTSVTDDVKVRMRTEIEKAVRVYIASGRALAARDESTRTSELHGEIIAATKPLLGASELSTLDEVVKLGYRPLPNEE